MTGWSFKKNVGVRWKDHDNILRGAKIQIAKCHYKGTKETNNLEKNNKA